jgi:dienelactone hydrolase
MAVKAFLSALAGIALWATSAVASEQPVDFPAGKVTLHAALYRPDGRGPFPAVIALHDCGGLNHEAAADAELYDQWAKLLVADRFVVLFPDSFGSRGLGPQCTARKGTVRASRERVADANAARHWLQSQPYVRSDHISLLGWASGAIAALWTVRPNAAPRDGSTDFRSAVALYPGCKRLRQTAWSTRVPTLILIGSADDWTPASTCQQMVAGARGRSARAEIIVYPGAHHGFDRANTPVLLDTGRGRSADPLGKAHRAINPAARTDALKRVPKWLAR